MTKRKMTEPTPDYGLLAEKALSSAIDKLVEERAREGGNLIVWENGKVVSVPASRLLRSKSNRSRTRHTPLRM